MFLYYIYCIWVKTEEGVLRYYGHTRNIRKRKSKHKCDHEKWVAAGRPNVLHNVGATRSVYVLEHPDWRMDVEAEVEHEDKKFAKKKARVKEGELILDNDCVNMRVECRTPQESKKHYREIHREQRNEYMKQYNETHREEHNERQKKYHEQHKAEISAKRAEKVTCDVCGSVVSRHALARHHKTTKHLNALAAQ